MMDNTQAGGLTDEQLDAMESAKAPSQPQPNPMPSNAQGVPATAQAPSVPHPSAGLTDDELDKLETSQQPQEGKYDGPGDTLLAGAEGAAQGVLTKPGTTILERGLSKMGVPGLSDEDIAGREAAHPVAHGIGNAAGLAGSMFVGTGEGAMLAKAGEAAANAMKLKGLGATAMKAAVEAGIFRAADKVGENMLNQSDPNETASQFIADVGANGVLGGGVGLGFGVAGKGASSLLGAAADTKVGRKAAEFLADFGNRWKFHQENPDLASAMTDELTNFHNSTSSAADEVYGPTGLKAKAITKLVPAMNEDIQAQSGKLNDYLDAKYANMLQDEDTYPARFAKKMSGLINEYKEVSTNPNASSNDLFNATQNLKQKLQLYSKFDKAINPLPPERGFVDMAKDIQHTLRTSLEDESVWGDAGKLQKNVNNAFTEFLPKQKEFLKRFATGVENEKVIDPDKIKTYVNQVSKDKGKIRADVLNDYIEAAQKYRDKINGIHDALGIESPLTEAPLSVTNDSLNRPNSAGSKFADLLHEHHNAGALGAAAATGVAGYALGGDHDNQSSLLGPALGAGAAYLAPKLLAPYFQKIIGNGISDAASAFMLKSMSEGKTNGLQDALEHLGSIKRGQGLIKNSINGVFTGGKLAGNEAYATSVKQSQKDKLDKFVKSGKLMQQLNQPSASPSPSPTPTQNFASGGQVQPQAEAMQAPQQESEDNLDSLQNHFPDSTGILSTVKGRVNQYLTDMQPQETPSPYAFDKTQKDPDKAKRYDRALGIAVNPLSILGHIQQGTITPELMQHMMGMYPEFHDHLKQQISNKVLDSKKKGIMPDYKTRQGLSVFMGAPMDATFSQQAIAAAQPKPQPGPPQPGPSGKIKGAKGAAALAKGPKMYQTASQSAEEDTNGRD